jgi:hypothetical protein
MDVILIVLFLIVLILTLLAVWGLIQYKKLSVLLKFMMFSMFIVGGLAQEEVPILEDPGFAEPDPGAGIEIPIDPGPLVFPGEMPKASHEISISYYGLMGEFNITNFDQEWLDFLNQTNLTA